MNLAAISAAGFLPFYRKQITEGFDVFENFLFSVNAVMPLVLTILLGYVLRRAGFVPEAYFRASDKLVYYVFFPCSLFCSMYGMNVSSDFSLGFIGYILAGTVLLFLLGSFSARLIIKDRASRSVSVMNTFRANTSFIGIPLAAAIAGDAGSTAMVATLLIAIPFFNLFTVIAFMPQHGGNGKSLIFSSLRLLITNPLIIGCLSGLAATLLRGYLPLNSAGEPFFMLQRDLPFLYSALSSVGSITSTVALLNIGGLIDFEIKGSVSTKSLVFSCVWRLILAPVMFIGAAAALAGAGLMSFTPAMFAAIFAHFGTPAAATNGAMAAELGGDANLARQSTVYTTVLAVFTLPIFIMLMRTFGLI